MGGLTIYLHCLLQAKTREIVAQGGNVELGKERSAGGQRPRQKFPGVRGGSLIKSGWNEQRVDQDRRNDRGQGGVVFFIIIFVPSSRVRFEINRNRCHARDASRRSTLNYSTGRRGKCFDYAGPRTRDRIPRERPPKLFHRTNN